MATGNGAVQVHGAPKVRAGASRGWPATLGESDKWNKFYRNPMGVREFVPLSHKTYGRVGPAAMKFLDTGARTAAGAGDISESAFLDNAMRRLFTTLCVPPETRRGGGRGGTWLAPSRSCWHVVALYHRKRNAYHVPLGMGTYQRTLQVPTKACDGACASCLGHSRARMFSFSWRHVSASM